MRKPAAAVPAQETKPWPETLAGGAEPTRLPPVAALRQQRRKFYPRAARATKGERFVPSLAVSGAETRGFASQRRTQRR